MDKHASCGFLYRLTCLRLASSQAHEETEVWIALGASRGRNLGGLRAFDVDDGATDGVPGAACALLRTITTRFESRKRLHGQPCVDEMGCGTKRTLRRTCCGERGSGRGQSRALLLARREGTEYPQ